MYDNESRLDRFKSFFRHVVLCCDKSAASPPLKIGPPTNFIHNPNPFPISGLGVSTEQQTFIREKAIEDAHRLASDVSLQSTSNSATTTLDPSGHGSGKTHTYQTIYPIPSPTPSQTRLPNNSPALPHHARKMSRVRMHGRKLSAKFSALGGHQGREHGTTEEMGDLMAGHRQGCDVSSEVITGVANEDVFINGDMGLKMEILSGRRSRDSVTLGGGSDDSDKEGVRRL